MKNINKKISYFLGLITILIFQPALAASNPYNVSLLGTSTTDIATIIESVIGYILNFVGAAAALFIVYGGFVYITSAGNEKRAEQAKKILTYAVIGLIVVILAKIIVIFVKTGVGSII